VIKKIKIIKIKKKKIKNRNKIMFDNDIENKIIIFIYYLVVMDKTK
jgi:hypothetical protein